MQKTTTKLTPMQGTFAVSPGAGMQALIAIADPRKLCRVQLLTNKHGDGLYQQDSGYPGGLGPLVLAARDFTLHDRDLRTKAGRHAARAYVRRKLVQRVA